MDARPASDPAYLAHASTDDIRRRFLVQGLMTPGDIRLTYLHEDRLVIGGAVPVGEPLRLGPDSPVRGSHFLRERELGILHVSGGPARVAVDDQTFDLDPGDMLYVGSGERAVSFMSRSIDAPAHLYLASARAHAGYPDVYVPAAAVTPVDLGSSERAGHRFLHKVIHPDHVRSCQLVMGYTVLASGSVWNTMPAHLHDRRTEVYFYYGLSAGDRVIHLLGEPTETRHVLVADEEAVVSPPWSIHCGAGTAPYAFCWAMAGENSDYGDMDPLAIEQLR